MQTVPANFTKLILVCTNIKDGGRECCGARGGVDLHAQIKAAVKAVAPTVRVSKTGCLDHCSTGPTVVIMPENLWLGGVTEQDIPEIVRLAQKN